MRKLVLIAAVLTQLLLPEPSAIAAPALYLPWTAGQRMFVLQGQNQGTHTSPTSRYAYDFSPGPFDGSSFIVRAAAPGRVLELREDFPVSSDCDPAASGRDNYVVVDHGDGTGAVYRHLARNSVLPTAGARIAQGDPLALTGHSGFVCGTTHLHFTVIDIRTRASLDVPFSDPDTLRDGGRPQTNQWYISANAPGGSSRVVLPYVTRRATIRR